MFIQVCVSPNLSALLNQKTIGVDTRWKGKATAQKNYLFLFSLPKHNKIMNTSERYLFLLFRKDNVRREMNKVDKNVNLHSVVVTSHDEAILANCSRAHFYRYIKSGCNRQRYDVECSPGSISDAGMNARVDWSAVSNKIIPQSSWGNLRFEILEANS